MSAGVERRPSNDARGPGSCPDRRLPRRRPKGEPATVARRLSSIRWAHEQAWQSSPTSHPSGGDPWAGVRPVHASEPLACHRPIHPRRICRLWWKRFSSTECAERRQWRYWSWAWPVACRRSELADRGYDLTEHPGGTPSLRRPTVGNRPGGAWASISTRIPLRCFGLSCPGAEVVAWGFRWRATVPIGDPVGRHRLQAVQ